CEEHNKPLGPNDRLPTDPVSITVALADKIDTLVGFWAIGEKPTGSKDPYALRRAALGAIRLTLENELRISLKVIFDLMSRHWAQRLQSYTIETTDVDVPEIIGAVGTITKRFSEP